jgi:hypothetical protein
MFQHVIMKLPSVNTFTTHSFMYNGKLNDYEAQCNKPPKETCNENLLNITW